MIKIKNLTKRCDVLFEATGFPDGTQQVWKMNPEPDLGDAVKVVWQFDNEREFITVVQVGSLLLCLTGQPAKLYCPYLPYARQDKLISNDTTFAKYPMLDLLGSFYEYMEAFDVHSEDHRVVSFQPDNFFSSIPKYDIICFPDAGAKKRYTKYFAGKKIITFTKVRDAKTGEIKKVKFGNPKGYGLKNKTILIVDDICDGGRTFIECAKILKTFKPKQIGLAVSHAILSQGLAPLNEAGIEYLYSTNSLPRNNQPGFFNVLDL